MLLPHWKLLFSYVKNGQSALKCDGKVMMNECHFEINIFLFNHIFIWFKLSILGIDLKCGND